MTWRQRVMTASFEILGRPPVTSDYAVIRFSGDGGGELRLEFLPPFTVSDDRF
jgi:hypothetical protein